MKAKLKNLLFDQYFLNEPFRYIETGNHKNKYSRGHFHEEKLTDTVVHQHKNEISFCFLVSLLPARHIPLNNFKIKTSTRNTSNNFCFDSEMMSVRIISLYWSLKENLQTAGRFCRFTIRAWKTIQKVWISRLFFLVLCSMPCGTPLSCAALRETLL